MAADGNLKPVPLHAQVLASLPVIIYELVHNHSERHIVVWFIAGLFVLLAVPLSLHDGGWARRGVRLLCPLRNVFTFFYVTFLNNPQPSPHPRPHLGRWGPPQACGDPSPCIRLHARSVL